jgi:hypothetical protein
MDLIDSQTISIDVASDSPMAHQPLARLTQKINAKAVLIFFMQKTKQTNNKRSLR